jgi:hypothetical protein
VNNTQKTDLFSVARAHTVHCWHRFLCSLLCLFFLLSSLQAVEITPDSLLNRRARLESAVKSIPFSRLPPPTAEAVQEVTSNPSFYRQLPPRVLQCDPQLMTFMVRHPEVMVNIWEMIGITNITTIRTGRRTFFADDGAGTKCNCELIYSDDELHIYYGTGDYDGFLTPRPVKGRVVCVLRAQAEPLHGNPVEPMVTSRMDVFLKVDNIGADLLTRTLAPLVGKVTEHNFEETSRFVCQLSEFCGNHPLAAQRLTEQLTVNDESIRREFESIVSKIAYKRFHAPGHWAPSTTSVKSREDEQVVLQSSIGGIQLATLPEIRREDHDNQPPIDESTKIPGPVQPRKSNIELRR